MPPSPRRHPTVFYLKEREAAVHRVWRQHRPADYVRRDRRLRITAVGTIVGGIAVAWLTGQAGWDEVALAAIIIACVLPFILMVIVQYAHEKHYWRFVASSFDEDGVFLYCLNCAYPLRGCERPRQRCPECGAEAWRCDRFAAGPGDSTAAAEPPETDRPR